MKWIQPFSAPLAALPIELSDTDDGLDLVLRELAAIELGLPSKKKLRRRGRWRDLTPTPLPASCGIPVTPLAPEFK
jgi:hypothetical protein